MIKINILASKRCQQQENATQFFRFFSEYTEFNNNLKIFPNIRFLKKFSGDVFIPVNCCPVNAFRVTGFILKKTGKIHKFSKTRFSYFYRKF